jgi:hopanoid biosynthesis associated RND transporter like protein HpnN
MIVDFLIRTVDWARRHAAPLAILLCLAAATAAWYAAGHLSIDTDIEHLLPKDVAWRQREFALDRAFPQNADLLAIVIDGRTPELADMAAAKLAAALAREPALFKTVRRPDGGPYFDKYGLLLQPLADVQSTAQQLVDAQPLIGTVAHDPSLRGLFDALSLFLTAAAKGEASLDRLNPALAAIAQAVDDALAGKPPSFSWQQIVSGKPPQARDLRRFVLAQPVLDFRALEPGGRARAEVRRLAHTLGLEPKDGVRVRMTGPVALNDEEFATLRHGIVFSAVLSVVSILVILFLALRSARLVGVILATVAAGLALTGGFAAVAIGSLNLVSIAFAILFIGLATDFSIQFSVRYRDERYRRRDFAAALRGTAATAGGAIGLAAAATAIGFLSFLPTNYAGISELGLIAGVGMVIGFTLNFTLLPALLTLARPAGEAETVGFRRLAPLDRFLVERRRWIIGAAALVALAGIALLPRLGFDYDPLDLKDPHTQSVSTLFDMMKDPTTNPYGAEAIAPSLAAADRLAERLSKLPEVDEVVTASSYIPSDQKAKLAALSDLSILLGPSLSPISTKPPPSESEIMASVRRCRDALAALAVRGGPDSPPARLADALDGVLKRGPAVLPAIDKALISGLPHELGLLRELLSAGPVSLASLPPDLRRSWLTPGGRARVEIFPKGNPRDHKTLHRFVAAVERIAPEVTGTPVNIQQSGRLISGAFLEAGIIAVAAITLLLALVLRRARDVLLVIAPLLLAAILTLSATVVLGMPLNYANIIALPLLLGIGVAFDIYFVMNWRAGLRDPLQSATARAVLFSALTTMTAFGSLALAQHPGTADMGKLLSLSLGCTLLCTFLVLPALLGPVPVPAEEEVSEPRWQDQRS